MGQSLHLLVHLKDCEMNCIVENETNFFNLINMYKWLSKKKKFFSFVFRLQ